MKFTLSWLKKFLNTDASIEEITNQLTKNGLEVEEVINQYDMYKDFIVAEIISTSPHPEADKLRICQVNNGKETLQIVCGAPNARAGIKVVLAPIGTEIPSNRLKIKESKIRNVLSCGMMCSSKELDLGDEHDGIIELNENYVVGSSFASSYGLNEVFIEISITPNRGDCLGVYGIARDLAASGIGTLKPLEFNKQQGGFTSPIKVELNSSHCSKYIGRYFKDIKNSPSPKWLQDCLHSIGVNPISALVDITNYFTFCFGRPLHVFDADLISKINVRDALDGEQFEALNNKTYTLKGGELVMADDDHIIALGGIIGGASSGVSLESKNIFLEIGLFDADSVAKTSRMHYIDSDAKFRFERKIDPEFMEAALDMASQMIIDLCGGTLSTPIIIDNYNYTSRNIEFPLNELEKQIGISYDKSHVKNILLSLGFKIEDKGEMLNLKVPSWRPDIIAKEDIIEEIARIDGYDNIPSIPLPNKETNVLDAKQRSLYRISRFAASLGLNELVTWSFMNAAKASNFSNLKDELHLKNPISSELDYMRPSILPNLLEAAEKNQNRGINDLKLFELGSTFQGVKPHQQILTITGLRTGMNHIRNLYGDSRAVDAMDAKSDIFAIINELGLNPNNLRYITDDLPKYYHPGRSAKLALGKTIVGNFGELHPKIIKSYGLHGNAVGFELFLDNIPLPKAKFGRKGSLQTSDFQMVERDFAFIVDQDVLCETIIKAISQSDKKLIKNINIFDIYSGKGIENNKKSIAFSVSIQAMDHTLHEQEIEQLCKKITNSVIKLTGGELRSGG